MFHEWLIGCYAERLFREQPAIANENAALAHQPDGRTEGDRFVCARWKEAVHDVDRSGQIGAPTRLDLSPSGEAAA